MEAICVLRRVNEAPAVPSWKHLKMKYCTGLAGHLKGTACKAIPWRWRRAEALGTDTHRAPVCWQVTPPDGNSSGARRVASRRAHAGRHIPCCGRRRPRPLPPLLALTPPAARPSCPAVSRAGGRRARSWSGVRTPRPVHRPGQGATAGRTLRRRPRARPARPGLALQPPTRSRPRAPAPAPARRLARLDGPGASAHSPQRPTAPAQADAPSSTSALSAPGPSAPPPAIRRACTLPGPTRLGRAGAARAGAVPAPASPRGPAGRAASGAERR